MSINPSHIFLTTSESVFTYGDLWSFTSKVRESYSEAAAFSPNTPIILLSNKDEKSALLISACFLAQIPIVVIPSDSNPEQVKNVIQETGANFYFSTNLVNEGLSGLLKINILDLNQSEYNKEFLEISDFNTHKLFAVLYTSGTTSIAKAVPITFEQITVAAKNSFVNLPLQNTDEWLLNLPLHHIGGISILTRSILSGSKVYLSSVYDTISLIDIFKTRNTLSYASLVPTQLKRLMESPNFEVHPNFKAILLGGGPISANLHRAAKDRGIPVVTSFGMTETTAQCIAVPLLSWKDVPDGTAGKPLNGVTIELRKDDNAGGSSLLWLKGKQVIEGYLNPKLNESAFDSDGWFNTGDYARVDENGFIFVEMRRSDRIVSGGENVNPIVIEEVLESHASISEAAVFGVDDEEWGQLVVAAIVLSKPSEQVDISDLKTHLKSILPGFMVPKSFIIKKELPRTTSGKLIRSNLIKLLDL